MRGLNYRHTLSCRPAPIACQLIKRKVACGVVTASKDRSRVLPVESGPGLDVMDFDHEALWVEMVFGALHTELQ